MTTGAWIRLRPVVVALAAVALVPLLAPAASSAGDRSELAMTELESSTVEAINAVRSSHGLAPLTVSASLFASATLHCEQMVEGGYFAHVSPDGAGFVWRLEAFYPQGGYRFYSVGENLLWTLDPMSAAAMVARWLKSPEHRVNILDPAWRQVGIAVLRVSSAPGVFAGEPATVVTADFGVRRSAGLDTRP
jgi:uncharacterized protein YkwD